MPHPGDLENFLDDEGNLHTKLAEDPEPVSFDQVVKPDPVGMSATAGKPEPERRAVLIGISNSGGTSYQVGWKSCFGPACKMTLKCVAITGPYKTFSGEDAMRVDFENKVYIDIPIDRVSQYISARDDIAKEITNDEN